MANSGVRLVYIMKYLYENTDDEHYVTAHRIIEFLETIGIHTHRQTVISDINEIKELGVNVISVRSSQNRFYIADRDFSMPELTLLVDAVSAAGTITKEQSDVLRQHRTKTAFGFVRHLLAYFPSSCPIPP